MNPSIAAEQRKIEKFVKRDAADHRGTGGLMAQPPFTDRWVFTGPNVAISCEVEYDIEQEEYHATGSGFHGTGDTAVNAALSCFTAWMAGRRGWYEPE